MSAALMDIARKIAALEALAASTTFAGERDNATAAAARLRAIAHEDEPLDEWESEREAWQAEMDVAKANAIIVKMVRNAVNFLFAKGMTIYPDGSDWVVPDDSGFAIRTSGDVLNMAINAGFRP